MSRSLNYDIPGADWRVGLGEAREKGWPAIFAGDVPAPLPLVVEIGFGRGEFLLDLASRAPETPFVGVEYSFKRTLKLARRLACTPLRNVRLVEAKAEDLLRDALPGGVVSQFWINFPDPWPKKRHVRRRLVQPAAAALLARRLAPDGRIDIATDHPGYAEWIDEVLSAEPRLRNRFAPEPFVSSVEARTPTAYELEWQALGRDLHFFGYELAAETAAEGSP